MSQVKRIAMWAVPRSMATALLRSWQNRSDTAVWDEPLMGPYIFHKGNDLGFTREQVLEADVETDWHKVIDALTGPLPDTKCIAYQKHQPHELLQGVMDIDWIEKLDNCFLIRNPKDMLLSLHKIVPDFTIEQTGWLELLDLYKHVLEQTGKVPPIIDARDLQNDPQHTLSLFCNAVDVPFDKAMLGWSAEEVDMSEQEQSWYESAYQSTHFRPYTSKSETLPDHLFPIFEQCDAIYQQLYLHRLH